MRSVIAVMADKEIETMLASLVSIADIWYIAQVEDARCLPAIKLGMRLKISIHLRQCVALTGLLRCQAAYEEAVAEAKEGLVVVAGSFHTVAAARMLAKC